MSQEDSEFARQALFEAIENQIEAGDSPETAQTLDRLQQEEYSHDEAMELIGSSMSPNKSLQPTVIPLRGLPA